jgi:antirestriction factor ArdC-like protein
MTLHHATFADLLARAITEPGRISRAYTAFHGYSIGNQLLALGQCDARGLQPGPIASFMGWKDKGRFVRKGEKALTLCMPITCKRKAETEGEDDAAFTRFVYKPNWFVLAQTDGQAVEPTTVTRPGRSRRSAPLRNPSSPLMATCRAMRASGRSPCRRSPNCRTRPAFTSWRTSCSVTPAKAR